MSKVWKIAIISAIHLVSLITSQVGAFHLFTRSTSDRIWGFFVSILSFPLMTVAAALAPKAGESWLSWTIMFANSLLWGTALYYLFRMTRKRRSALPTATTF